MKINSKQHNQKFKNMEEMTVKVTKLFKIINSRGMNQTDLRDLIKETNGGKAPELWILSELITGKKTNPTLKTLRPIKKALNVSWDELIDDEPVKNPNQKDK